MYDNFRYKFCIGLRSFLEILKFEEYKHVFKDYFLDMLKEVTNNSENKNEVIDLMKIKAIYSELSKLVHPNNIGSSKVPKNVQDYINNYENWDKYANIEIDKLCDLLIRRNVMTEGVIKCRIDERGLYVLNLNPEDNSLEKWVPFKDLNDTQKPHATKQYFRWTQHYVDESNYVDWFLKQISEKFKI